MDDLYPEEVSRIGRISDTRPRLLRFKCSSTKEKAEVLRLSKKLRSTQDYYNKVFVNPDLTLLQRKRDKQLRDEVKRRREEGEEVYIRRGRIVNKANAFENFQRGF